MNVSYRLFLLFFAFVMSLPVFTTVQKLPNNVFDVGEKLVYDAYYNWSFLWIKAGIAEFSVEKENDDRILLKATGSSLPQYDWIFRVRDSFVSEIDSKTLKPLYFKRSTSEGRYWVKNQFFFDYNTNNVNCVLLNKDRKANTSVKSLDDLRDVLSAVYYCRSIDFSAYKIGDKIPIQLLIEGDTYPVYLRLLGYQNLVLKNGKTYNTIKFSVKLVEGTIFNGGEKLTVFVTNDLSRKPVYVEGEILVGSVKAIIRE